MLKNLKELLKYRELFLILGVREIKIRYRQTLLGFGWAILHPLAMMVVFTVIFSKFLHLESESIPYPIFSYSALLFWMFFATSLSFGPNAMIRMAETIKKIYFPREIVPMAAIFAAFFDLLIASVIFAGMMVYYKIAISPYLLFLPLIVTIQIIFTIGVILLLSTLNVFYRDIRHGIPFLVQIWMYATPIVYAMDAVPIKYRYLYVGINPMAGLIDSYRRVILHQKSPDLIYLLIAILVSIFLAIVCYWLFKKLDGNFADVI